MKMMKIPLYFSLCMAGLAASVGQTANKIEDVKPPSPPYVMGLPTKARWITARVPGLGRSGGPSGEVSPASSGFKIESVLWNSVKTDVVEQPGASPSTLVYYGGFVLVDGQRSSGEQSSVLVQQIPGTNYSNLRSPGWLGLEWITSKFYVEPRLYKRTLSASEGGDAEEITHFYKKPAAKEWEDEYVPELSAWIRVSDGMPVAVAIDDAVFEFQILAPPLQPPIMSAQQSQKLLQHKDQHDRMMRLLSRSKSPDKK